MASQSSSVPTSFAISHMYRRGRQAKLLDLRWTYAGLTLDLRWTCAGLTQRVNKKASETALPITLPQGHHLRAVDTANAFRHKSGCKLEVLTPCVAISVMRLWIFVARSFEVPVSSLKKKDSV